jgi:hypothetical protein
MELFAGVWEFVTSLAAGYRGLFWLIVLVIVLGIAGALISMMLGL